MTSSAAASVVVVTAGLTRRFGQRTVVEALDLSVPHGVIAGFVGPNGAGKTTTLRMLLGLVAPSAGGGQVLGCPLTRPQDPVEALLTATVHDSGRWLPGQLLSAIAAGGTTSIGFGRGLLVGLLYAAAALATAAMVFRRRDVTS